MKFDTYYQVKIFWFTIFHNLKIREKSLTIERTADIQISQNTQPSKPGKIFPVFLSVYAEIRFA